MVWNARHADDVRVVRDWKLTIRSDGTATLPAEASARLAGGAPKPWRRGGGGGEDLHIIRTNRVPLIQGRAGLPLTVPSRVVMGGGTWLPISPFADALGFVALPRLDWPLLIVTLFSTSFSPRG